MGAGHIDLQQNLNTDLKQKINKNEIHQYFICIRKYKDYLPYFLSILSGEEVVRAEKFHFDKDTIRYIIGYGFLRLILSSYLYIDPKEIRVIENEYGKPRILDEQNHQLINFNMSHSEEAICYAITVKNQIGIDIEYIRKMHDHDTKSIIDRFATEYERMIFNSLSLDRKLRAFYKWWTQKEAVIKAIGKGLSYNIKDFSVEVDPHKPAGFIRSGDKYNSFYLSGLYFSRQYIGAVSVKAIDIKKMKSLQTSKHTHQGKKIVLKRMYALEFITSEELKRVWLF